MRSFEELRSVDDPAWPAIDAAIAEAQVPVTVLRGDQATAEATLVGLQVTARSALGALILHTGGVLVDHGWLRILGGGEPAMNLLAQNPAGDDGSRPGRLVIAIDALGGAFAVNGGDLPGTPGEVCYFAPDELAWVRMDVGHSAFIEWSLTDDFGAFFEHLRWPGWEAEVEPLPPDRGILPYPFPFTVEGRDLGATSRKDVPIAELLEIWPDLARQVDQQRATAPPPPPEKESRWRRSRRR